MPLVFLYLVDISFLNKIARGGLRPWIKREIEHMGRFILDIAVERALDEGVHAEAVLGSGAPSQELPRMADELGATVVVCESPSGEAVILQEEQLKDLLGTSGQEERDEQTAKD